MSIPIHLVITIRQMNIQKKVKTLLSAQEECWEELLGNQNNNKKHHSEEEKLKKAGLPNFTELSKHYNGTSDATHYDYFRCEGKRFSFKERNEPLTNEDGKLRAISKLKSTVGIRRLIDLGFIARQLTHADAARFNKKILLYQNMIINLNFHTFL